ncbi:homoserine O-acetyltransferase [Epidermidibacterium keratini]|uniref:Homoserine O-acetyltransferase n=1 Tax=Epidermidibacterium keratini TaxID=1891644 RepID=A0A7L4YTM8_9ACTN|nr:homoserine O-acetyltransferase [Epidermidibacterium keratini]
MAPAGPGGWRPGDPVADRKFASLGALRLELGTTLPDVEIAYESWGTLNAAGDNAVLIEHALTGDAHVVGAAGPGQPTPGWWDGLIGPGRYLDTDRYFVIASNVLGGCQGTTGPSSLAPDGRAWGSRFPFVTVRDQVHAERRLADLLGITTFRAVIGGSMGGMRAIEWPLMYPDRVARAVVLASTPYATADEIAWCAPQLAAIEADPAWHGGDYYETDEAPTVGLGIARSIAHVTYRSEYELTTRFGREPQPGENPLGGQGRYAVESYLDHHRDKLIGRFDAGSYVVLTRAMNAHDIARGRGDLASAVSEIQAQVSVVGVSSDRLYPVRLSEELYAALPEDRRELAIIDSPYGHDGFLIELDAVGKIINDAVR